MSALMTWVDRFGLSGRRALAPAAAVFAVGALAAGCGAAHIAPASSGTSGQATAPTASASASATPVRTVTGGPAVAGGPACVGWPTDVKSASLPVSFVPVSVERCVNGVTTVPGGGLWTSATLQRADSGLEALTSALRHPSAARQPGTVCPAIAIVPQQVVLTNAAGQRLMPKLPVSGCGLIQSQVLAALSELHWRPVSVRLIAKVPGATPTVSESTAPRPTQTAPGPVQTVNGGGVQPQ